MPRILLTNDDGYNAPGILALAEAIMPLGEVLICAPERNHSGAGSSFTTAYANNPPLTARLGNCVLGKIPCMVVTGTPVDSTKYALQSWLRDDPPDLVVSGINHGANIGRSVRYSGTLGALFEAGWSGFPCLAVSVDAARWPEYPIWEAAQYYAAIVAKRMLNELYKEDAPSLLSLNVPSGKVSEVKGLRLGAMGRGGYSETIEKKGNDQFVITGKMTKDNDPDAPLDGELMHSGYAALTPLSLNWTDNAALFYMKNDKWEI